MPNKMQKITIEDLLTLIAQGEGEKIDLTQGLQTLPKPYMPWLMPVDAIKGIFRKSKVYEKQMIYKL